MLKKILLSLFCASLIFPVATIASCGETKKSAASYDLYAEFDGEKIDGTLTYRFSPTEDTSNISFNLYANAYKEEAKRFAVAEEDMGNAYPDGLSYGEIAINGVTLNGENANYELIGEDLNVLSVKIGNGLSNKETALKIDFTTKIPNSLTRLGRYGDAANLSDFFPVACVRENGGYKTCEYSPYGDPYYSVASDYSVSVKVPSEYVVASSGSPTETLADGEYTTYSYSLSLGRDFALALNKNYTVIPKKCGDIDVYYYSLSQNDEDAALAADAIKYFSETFGAYPYKTYSVAEVPLITGGMEYSGLSYISNSLQGFTKKLAILHETAHQWWHGGVGNDQTEEAFLDEGLAEYSTYLYLLNNGYAAEAKDMLTRAKTAYKTFFDIKELLSGNKNTVMKRPLSTFSSKYEYINIAYNKPLIMMSEYENTMGQKKAIKGLKHLYEKNLYKNITSDALPESLGLKEFFNSYIEGKVII